jgi:hypothetical protein
VLGWCARPAPGRARGGCGAHVRSRPGAGAEPGAGGEAAPARLRIEDEAELAELALDRGGVGLGDIGEGDCPPRRKANSGGERGEPLERLRGEPGERRQRCDREAPVALAYPARRRRRLRSAARPRLVRKPGGEP